MQKDKSTFIWSFGWIPFGYLAYLYGEVTATIGSNKVHWAKSVSNWIHFARIGIIIIDGHLSIRFQ